MSYICNLCPRKCEAVRNDTENIGGVCSMPYNLTLARASKHMWEEPCISGTNCVFQRLSTEMRLLSKQ